MVAETHLDGLTRVGRALADPIRCQLLLALRKARRTRRNSPQASARAGQSSLITGSGLLLLLAATYGVLDRCGDTRRSPNTGSQSQHVPWVALVTAVTGRLPDGTSPVSL